MSQVEIRLRGRRLEQFDADVDPEDEITCVALLRRRAVELRRPVGQLTLRIWPDRRPGRRREYRA